MSLDSTENSVMSTLDRFPGLTRSQTRPDQQEEEAFIGEPTGDILF